MITIWQIWLAIALLFVVAELLTMTFAFFCFALGCLTACAAAALDYGIIVQLGAFSAGTALSFLILFPLAKKWRKRKTATASNMDALIGRTGTLIEAIAPAQLGRVKIDGDRWQARSVAGTSIAAGTQVKVVAYDSIILEVEAL